MGLEGEKKLLFQTAAGLVTDSNKPSPREHKAPNASTEMAQCFWQRFLLIPPHFLRQRRKRKDKGQSLWKLHDTEDTFHHCS